MIGGDKRIGMDQKNGLACVPDFIYDRLQFNSHIAYILTLYKEIAFFSSTLHLLVNIDNKIFFVL